MKCLACISAKFLVIHKAVRSAQREGVMKGAAGGRTAKDRGGISLDMTGEKIGLVTGQEVTGASAH